jgi:PKD repeat protein
MKNIYSILFMLLSVFCFSQNKVKDTITRRATIVSNQKANVLNFQAEVPTLNQILGAPKANYSFLWEMGDGSYSKEPNPKKVYKAKGEYKVNLSVTNNYDNGKPPKTRPKTVAVNEILDTNYSPIASLQDSISLKLFTNREPVPDEEMVAVLTYQNPLNYVANGKLYLFYNDAEFKNKNFELLESRTHFGEREILPIKSIASVEEYNNSSNYLASSFSFLIKNNEENQNLEQTLAESKTAFKDSKIFEFEGMNPNETRNIFFTFKTTPEMIKDTSATVKIRGVFVPDRNYKNHKTKTLEMEIVTSHDPNKMSSNATFMNYRLVRFKTVNFKTRFQNDGEGPARMIRLETDIPDMFDKKTLKIVDSYPKCPICPKGEEANYSCLDTIIKQKQIHFTFKNIYIPGSTQKNVTEKDSTKGFVKYTMKFAKDFHKEKTRSKTAIIFDKNEPVITNYAVTRFLPGISIGARVGINQYKKIENSKSYFIGATISPYKSYRFYWQSEIMVNRFNAENGFQNDISSIPIRLPKPVFLENGLVVDATYNQSITDSKTNKTLIDVVPISIRYNINNYLGLGFGSQLSVPVGGEIQVENINKFYQPIFNATGAQLGDEILKIRNTESSTQKIKTFSNIQTSFFADLTMGFARIGPSIGARFYKSLEKNFDYWQFYGIWKF